MIDTKFQNFRGQNNPCLSNNSFIRFNSISGDNNSKLENDREGPKSMNFHQYISMMLMESEFQL